MIGGRGECWRIYFPPVKLLQQHEQPYCKCCHQRLPLAPLEPSFRHCLGENTGYDPCRSADVLSRWNEKGIHVDFMIDDDWQIAHGQYLYLSKESAELLLWAFGHDVVEDYETVALTKAKSWLELAVTTSIVGWRREHSLRFTETRKVYAEWTLKRVKMRLRAMKKAGRISKSTCVR